MNAFLIFAILSVTLLVAHAQVSTKAGSCPSAEGLIGTCDEACSSDDSCPGTQKCCSNGCGHACVDVANSTTPVVKPGTCPPAGVAGLCFEGCSSDSVCENAKKCCSNGCGHTCQMPTECAGQTCRVNEVCDVKTNSCKCPGTVFNCFLDPCTNAKCDVVGAKCVSSYCGGCNVEFLMDDGTKANCGSTTDSCNDCAGQVRPMIADVLCSDGVNSAGYRCNKTSCKYEFQECPACNDCAGQMRPMIADVLCSDGVSVSGYRCNKTSCKYQFQECPACNDCAGQMRPMIADVLCSDGVNSAGYRCNKTTCKYQFQDCPKTDCNDCAGQVRPMIADVKCSDGISVSGYRCNKDTCKYEFQDCPKPTTCNDCAGQMRPMIADITCSDGISVSGYRCNKVTCQYEFQKCPDASCDSCTVNTLIACPTSSAGNPCGKKVCQLVNGVCVGYLSCADCPVDTKPTCQVGGCNSELCYSSGVGPAPVSICALIAPLNPPCTRLTACQYNETAGNCMWLNNDAYLKCLSDPNHVPVDDCKSRTPCTCTSNPKCAYCKSTITLADGTTTSLGLCMSQDIAASKCLTPKASLGLGGNLLTAACDTPVKLAPIANSIDTVKESDVQTKINEILSGTTIATKFSIMLEHIVDAVQSGVDPTQDVVRLLTTLGGNGDPSAADKVTLCKVISDAIAAKIGTSKRVINCNFIKVDDKSVSVKRGISQTSSSTYMSETTFGNDNTNNNTANTATFPGYAIAIIIIVIIVVIAVVIAILLLRNGRKNEPMLDYH